ncbi:STAS domain-containing protein [Nonomuraea sp. NPDC050680]|uniref:STAS domain-containing protein n=1 Tax=Nonomuraea sp. NPDC050680 TaxID=3154630 RepID=UPI0033C8F1CA
MTGNRPPDRPASSSGELEGQRHLEDQPAVQDQQRLEDQRHVAGPVESAVLLDQPFDRGSLYALRATLEAHAIQAGLPEGRSADLVLLGHELASNVILHGSGNGWVRLAVADGMLRCEVVDSGAAHPKQGTPGWPYQFGHGLWIARFLSDFHTVSHGPGGTVVTVDFALPSPLRPAFELTRHSQNGRTTLSLVGDLDQRTAPDVIATVESLISTTKPLRLVLDLSGMTFWDSTGITALVTSQEHVAAAPGATMALAGLSAEHQGRLDSLGFVSFTYDNISH